MGASPWVYPRETGLLSPNPKPPVLDDADPTNADPTPALPPQDGGSEGRIRKGRKEGRNEEANPFRSGDGEVSGEFLGFPRAAVLLYWEEGCVRRDKARGCCREHSSLFKIAQMLKKHFEAEQESTY